MPLPENRVTLADEKDQFGMPIPHFNYNQCENDRAIVDYAKNILMEIWDGAGAEDTLAIDRYAHLVGGARMGFTADDSVVDSVAPRVGRRQPLRRRRLRHADGGCREPRARDHGAGGPLRLTARAEGGVMPPTISNPRDLVVELLGQILYVERRLHDAVLPTLASAVTDGELLGALRAHQEETRRHVERAEEAFRLIGVPPTSNLSQAFEGAIAEHERVAPAVQDDALANLFHARAALHSEHWELAAYRALIPLVGKDVAGLLERSLDEEQATAKLLEQAIDRLADAG